MEPEVERIDPQIFIETQVWRRKLRLVRNTIRHREYFLNFDERILLQLGDRVFFPQKTENFERRLRARREELEVLRQREKDIEAVLEKYPEIYRDWQANVLDSASWTYRDC